MYLTGVRQPGILAAISSARGSGKGAFTLFVPDVSQAAAQWDGALLNNAAAEEVFGAHAAFPMSQVPLRAHAACCLHTFLRSHGMCARTAIVA
jgi:Aminopeptidase P, N-terminal domain